MSGRQSKRVDEGRLQSVAEAGVVSRRTFLASSGTAVALSGAVVNAGEQMVAQHPDDVVLGVGDLRTTSDAEYARVGNSPADSKVLSHLETSIAGFRHVPTAVSGFAATDAGSIPKYVESAAVALPESIAPDAVARKTDNWLTERFEATDALATVDHDIGRFTEEWRSRTAEGWQDVFRVVHAGDGLLIFSVAYGRESAELAPDRAAASYEKTMRERAFEPA